jgi:hypothetical protein
MDRLSLTAEMSCMIRIHIGCILMALTAVLAPARPGLAAGEDLSRIGLAGEVPRTARRLAAADELAAQEKWADAIDEYQRILTEAGDDLVSLDTRHSLQARRVCHLRLAALPPAALALWMRAQPRGTPFCCAAWSTNPSVAAIPIWLSTCLAIWPSSAAALKKQSVGGACWRQ